MNQALSSLLDLSGRTAIVTGGARGIGCGIVNRLYQAGANVVVADIDGGQAEKVVGELGARAKAVRTDVSDQAQVETMVREAIAAFGSLDILVNNAGIFPMEPVMEMGDAHFMRVIKTNLESVYLCTMFAARAMIENGRGGKIINITSIDAVHPSMVGLAHYDASKHGVWGFTKNSALELARHNVWVNAVAPGGIATPGVAAMTSGQSIDADTTEKFVAAIPMHRMGNPDDIGKAVLFVASDMCSYMTGSQIVVDGGALIS